MARLAVLFAGQGAQKSGMGKDLYAGNAAAREVFERAEKNLPGITEMCFSGAQELLNQTINTQPCVYTMDVAAFAAFQSAGLKMSAAAGFSLGEYAALCCAGVFSFEEGLTLVKKRAEWMQKEAEASGGGMAAVLGKTGAEVDEFVSAVLEEGILEAVNYNCPGQTVVAGDQENLAAFLAYCRENKIKAMSLPVNGAFHSRAMAKVSEFILDYIKDIDFKNPGCPVYSNTLARPYREGEIKKVLAAQTSRPVYFEQILHSLMQNGFDTFVEVGPGSTLSGFVKRTEKDAVVYNIADMDSLNRTAFTLKEE